MIEFELKEMFSAAHALRDYPGACRNIHGHNWTVTARIRAGEPDETGMCVDYAVLKNKLTGILGRFDHQFINDLPYFHSVNPTSERIAEYIYNELEKDMPPGIILRWVKISETEQFSVIYKKNESH